jgi:hypothetical protein
MPEYPTCSQYSSANDDFEGPCLFHSNILSQDCSTQYNWLESTLKTISTSDWLIVVGHHPIDECDVNDLTTLLQRHGFSLYLNGHSHLLNQYTIDGSGVYITTGAGALVSTMDQQHPLTAAKLAGKDISLDFWTEGEEEREENKKKKNNSKKDSRLHHSYHTVWSQQIAGFTSHTFNSDFSQLTTSFISSTGQRLRSFTVDKSGKIVS